MSTLLRSVILGSIFCSAFCAFPVAARAYKANVGDRAAPFKGYDIVHHRSIDLEDYLGRWVFVDFWASWCGPCMHELPSMIKQTASYVQSGKLAVVTVSLDDSFSLLDLKKAIKRYRMPYPVIFGGPDDSEAGWDTIPAREWGVKSVPASYLIDPQGVIVANEIRGDKLAETLDFYIHGGHPILGLRGSQVLHDDGSISIFAEVMNPGREDVKVELHTYDIKMIWDDQAKTYKDVSTYDLIDSASLAFDDFCESTHEFVLAANDSRYVFVPYLEVTVPNSEHIGDANDPGIRMEWRGDEFMLLDVERVNDKYIIHGKLRKRYS